MIDYCIVRQIKNFLWIESKTWTASFKTNKKVSAKKIPSNKIPDCEA